MCQNIELFEQYSAKGLKALNYTPPQSQNRLGDSLITQLKNQSQQAVSEIIRQIINSTV